MNTGGVHYDVVLEIEDNESVHDSSVIENRLKGDCVNEQSEEFSGVERRVLKRGDISFDEERNQMSIQVLCRRGGTEKILGAECQEDYLSGAPPSVGAERTENFEKPRSLRRPEMAFPRLVSII